mmetsp:Transcript_4903/g.14525  ORF Transcript_4903/g.14525 Transcript_4903/m.14525 type:complete len:208 (+) Transcript_4903:1168-1791(+)
MAVLHAAHDERDVVVELLRQRRRVGEHEGQHVAVAALVRRERHQVGLLPLERAAQALAAEDRVRQPRRPYRVGRVPAPELRRLAVRFRAGVVPIVLLRHEAGPAPLELARPGPRVRDSVSTHDLLDRRGPVLLADLDEERPQDELVSAQEAERRLRVERAEQHGGEGRIKGRHVYRARASMRPGVECKVLTGVWGLNELSGILQPRS